MCSRNIQLLKILRNVQVSVWDLCVVFCTLAWYCVCWTQPTQLAVQSTQFGSRLQVNTSSCDWSCRRNFIVYWNAVSEFVLQQLDRLDTHTPIWLPVLVKACPTPGINALHLIPTCMCKLIGQAAVVDLHLTCQVCWLELTCITLLEDGVGNDVVQKNFSTGPDK